MKLTWSHAVLKVRDIEQMLDFYTGVLGFEVSDRGGVGGETEIVFLSQSPDEHHQLAMMNTRTDEDPVNSLDHLAFRTPGFADLMTLHERLAANELEALPLSHGNTLSLYFSDPEGNGVEVFWDTPWHVAQPQAKVWDPALEEPAALEWVKEHFGEEATFEPAPDFYARQRESAG